MLQAFRWLASSAVAAFFSVPVRSQERLKLFIGYSYLRPSVTYQQAALPRLDALPYRVP